jgi:hypothetical protein
MKINHQSELNKVTSFSGFLHRSERTRRGQRRFSDQNDGQEGWRGPSHQRIQNVDHQRVSG